MNLRIGTFGRQESASAVWVCAFASGCFAVDNRALFHDGNFAYFAALIASLISLLLFCGAVRAIRRRGGCDLSALIGRSRIKAALAVPLILSLLLSAMQPQQQFLLTITQYVFVDAKQVSVCFYLLPCLILLSMLGAETLVRTSRILLPVLVLSVLAALAIGVQQYRVYRLYPIPFGKPTKLLSDTAIALHRTCMFLGLSLSFSYAMLSDMPAPFYRMLVEARTENPTLRLDRAALFLWMSGALLASSIYLYAASVLFCRAFHVRDVRPVACAMSTAAVAAILVLYHDTDLTLAILERLYRYGWLLAVVPIPFLRIRGKERTPCGACA